MTCREFIDFLEAYRSRELPAPQAVEFERHMGLCPSCVSYLRSYEETIRLGRKALCDPEGPVPQDAPEELIRAILAARKKAQ
ncbi:MAG: hypothetical protein DCC65_16550 [Planctomycetota bacterium]|nr:MAG: hypothetical protein DCC65_16550 [Planctomycetota bacterium]